MTADLNLGEVAIAGAVCGFVTRALCQPFDVVKIRFQLQVEPIKRFSGNSKYKSTLQAVQTVLKDEGLVGLWRGHSPAQMLSILYGVVQFTTFEAILQQTSGGPVGRFVSGATAGTLATVFSFPFDVLRTRFIVQGNLKTYKWTGQGMVMLWRLEGIQGMFRGLSPTLLQAIPLSGAVFVFQNTFARGSKYIGIESKLANELISGCLAGICAKTLVYPLDLARKRLQLQGFHESRQGFGKNFTCSGLMHCLWSTWMNEGSVALFKGLVPSCFKAGATTALYFTVYQETMAYFQKRENDKERKPK